MDQENQEHKIVLRTNGLPFATARAADLRIAAMAKQGKDYQRIPWTAQDDGKPVEGYALERIDSEVRRKERIPVGQRNRLTAPRRPGYKRRFVNVQPGRVQMFEDAGYQMVTDQTYDPDNPGVIKAGSQPRGTTPLGSAVVEEVGGGQQAVLMEIREDWFNEDQARKARRLDEMEAQIKRRPKKNGHYGSVKAESAMTPPPKDVADIDMDQGHF
ncbi:MAG: hypothetical protein JRI94_00030 [Deltaproteobacteria bacterium]|nr:hypothetical protein [Deltaproteobacteria bacterium]MBW2031969.1 hypothetical protein [Deltaproteobacteria bacterium]